MVTSSSIFLLFSVFQLSRHVFVQSQPFSLLTSTESGIELQGFLYKSFSDSKLSSCFFACMEDGVCQSINFDTQHFHCVLNNDTKRHKPKKVRPKRHGVYMENPQRAKKGSNPLFAGHSCKEIKDLGESRGDGEYWIDPGNTGQPFTVYCDMTTDGGGWILIKRAKLPTAAPKNFVAKDSYRSLSNYADYTQLIDSPALQKLREDMGFHQLRFRCRKKSINRTLHIMTTNNTAGHKVLDHFLVKTTWPTACGSFERLPDDMSILARNCMKWGYNDGKMEVNRWGYNSNRGPHRIYTKAIIWENKYYFTCKSPKFLCDDKNEATRSVGDVCELFVR